MSLRARLARGAAWSSSARLISNILNLISTLVLARILFPADFGLVAIATTILAVLSSFSEIPIGAALIQHRDPQEEHFHTAWTISLIRSIILALIFSAISYPASILFNDPRLNGIMLALSGSIIIGGLGNPQTSIFIRDLVFSRQFLLDVAQKFISVGVSIAVALEFHSYWALVLGQVASQVAGVAISYVIIPYRPKFSLKHWRDIFDFSVWLTLGQVVNTLNWRLDHLLIGGILGKTALGYYSVGDNLANMPTREAISPLTAPLFPAFSAKGGDKAQLVGMYQSAQAFITAVALPAGVGVALVAGPLVRLTMSDKWESVIFIIQMLASVYAAQTLGSLAQPLAMATGRTRLLFQRDLQGLLMRIPLILLGLFLGGLKGVIYARVISGSIGIAFNFAVVKKILDIGYYQQLKSNFRTILSVLLMAAIVYTAAALIDFGRDAKGLLIQLGFLSILGALSYTSIRAVLWQCCGRPVGPEADFIQLIVGAGKKFRQN